MSRFFIHPSMLIALAAVAIPLIIEWLFRFRKRQVELPTLRFLLDNKEQEKIRRQDRILLILRSVALFLLVMALTRPLIQRSWLGADSRLDAIIVLDGTASMSQHGDMGPLFTRARSQAAGIIRNLPAGSTATVILLGDSARIVVETTSELKAAADLVESLSPTSGAAAIVEALTKARDIIKAKQMGSVETYVFSDFQRQTWLPASVPSYAAPPLPAKEGGTASPPAEPDDVAGQTRAMTEELGKLCRLHLIDAGGKPQFNFLITKLEPESPVMSTDLPVYFRVTVEARGQVPEGKNATVTLMIRDTPLVPKTCDMRAGSDQEKTGRTSRTLTFKHTFTKPDEYPIKAIVEGDEHLIDNEWLYLCSVPRLMQVLILDGQAGHPTSDSHALGFAVAPNKHRSLSPVSHFATKVVPHDQLGSEKLANYCTVVLTATDSLTRPMVEKLTRYVSEGGSLLVFLGPDINVDDYNELLYGGGEGVLPFQLVQSRAASQPDEQVNGIPVRFGHGAADAALRDLRDAGVISDAGVLQYYAVKHYQPDSVILCLANDDPLFLEKKFKRGKVVACVTTAGYAWNYMSAVPEYNLLVQQLLKYLADDRDAKVNLAIGQEFAQPLRGSAAQPQLQCPDGRIEPLVVTSQPDMPGEMIATFAGTDQAGDYEVVPDPRGRSKLVRNRFVVNQSDREADLRRLSQLDFGKQVTAAGYTWVDPDTDIVEKVVASHKRLELAPGLIWSLVGLMGIESLLAWRFGRRRGGITS